MATDDLVVVTGASGFLGSSVTLAFLEAGFRVRGTVRTAKQGDQLVERHPYHAAKYSYALVPDIKVPGAFKEAIKGATYVIHTAAPALAALDNSLQNIEEELLKPNIAASQDLMETLAAEGGIKAVVITSSFTTCRDYTKPEDPERVYTANDWGPITYEQAAAMKVTSDARQMMVPNSVGKALAEKTAWKFVEERKPGFTLTTILPTWVTGPSREPGMYTIGDIRNNTSTKIWQQLVDKTTITEPNLMTAYVDVEDCAIAHVRAIQRPETQGKRYLLLSGSATVAKMASRLRVLFPEQAHRIAQAPVEPDAYKADASPTEKAFDLKFTTLDESLKKWGDVMFALPP